MGTMIGAGTGTTPRINSSLPRPNPKLPTLDPLPSLEYNPEKCVDVLGISCYNKNSGTKKSIKV